jgi:AcrR family transcriptional regulator
MSRGHKSRIRSVSHASKSVVSAGSNARQRIVAEGRRERRAAETRVRIFRCALELIASRGLSNVTVEDITEAADVGKGTFFNYFASKDHVLGVMAEIQLGKIREALARRKKRTTRFVLHELMLSLAKEPGRSPRLARALISSFLGSQNVRGILKRNMREGRKSIGEIVAAGQRLGEINPRLNQEKVAMQFLQTVLGTVLLWSLHEKPKLGLWMEDSFQHFWRSIAASGRSRNHEVCSS